MEGSLLPPSNRLSTDLQWPPASLHIFNEDRNLCPAFLCLNEEINLPATFLVTCAVDIFIFIFINISNISNIYSFKIKKIILKNIVFEVSETYTD